MTGITIISNDTPVTSIVQDRLDFTPYVQALAEVSEKRKYVFIFGCFDDAGQ